MLSIEIPEHTASTLRYLLLTDAKATTVISPQDASTMVFDAVETASALGRVMDEREVELLSKTRTMSWLASLSDAVVDDIQSAGILWDYRMTSFFDGSVVGVVNGREVHIPIVLMYIPDVTIKGIVREGMDLSAAEGVDVAAAAIDEVVENLPEMAAHTITILLHKDED